MCLSIYYLTKVSFTVLDVISVLQNSFLGWMGGEEMSAWPFVGGDTSFKERNIPHDSISPV